MRYPMAALHRQLEIFDAIADIGFHLAPEEPGISLGQIGRAGIAQPFVDPYFGELMEQCIELARIQRVGQLSDQIGSAQQASLGVGLGVIVIVRNRKAGQFDGTRDTLAVDQGIILEAFAHNDLRAKDVVGRQVRVGSTAGQRNRVSRLVNDLPLARIAFADIAQIPDIVREGRDNEVQPVFRRDVPSQSKAAQDVLCDLSHQGGVLRIVIQRIAGGEAFDYQPGSFIERSSDRLIAAAERAEEGAGQVSAQFVGQQRRHVQHGWLLRSDVPPAMLRRRLPIRNWRD